MLDDSTFDVTVVVPCYNTADFSEECLQSALDQEGVSVEVIVVDDCSTDHSSEIAQRIARDNDNVVFIQNETNMGQARSRNRAFGRAHGEYISLLDSDDFYANRFVLKHLVAIARRTESEMVISPFDFLYSNGNTAPGRRLDTKLHVATNIEEAPEFAHVGAGCQIMYSRRFLVNNGLRYSEDLRQREDRAFFNNAFLRSERIVATDAVGSLLPVCEKISPHNPAPHEGIYDIARLCICSERYDLLLKLLEGTRLNDRDLRSLIAADQYPWARSAVVEYMRFSRGSPVPGPAEIDHASAIIRRVGRLVLHIGQPKTGSSALQTVLEEIRLDLADQGVLFPLTGSIRPSGPQRHRTSGHFNLVSNLISGDGTSLLQLAGEIEDQPVPVDTLVISSEGLLSHLFLAEQNFTERNSVKELVDALGIQEVEIFGALRDPENWLRSYFRERAANMDLTVLETPAEFARMISRMGLLDYDEIRAVIEQIPQVTRLELRDYDSIPELGVVRWFLSSTGLADPSTLAAGGRRNNQSYSDAQALKIFLSKGLNFTPKEKHDFLVDVKRDEVLRDSNFSLFPCPVLSWIDKNTDGSAPDRARDDRLAEAWFDSLFAEGNAEIFRRVFSFSAVRTSSSRAYEINRIKSEKGVLLARIEALETSTSWRLTYPIRKIVDLLRRWRR